MSAARYKHTQIGWSSLGIIALVAVIAAFALINSGFGPFIIAFIGIEVAVALMVGSLTVTVDEEDLRVRFGIGPLGKRIPLSTIRSFVPMRIPWYYGIGIHYFIGGAIYNVHVGDGVEVLLDNGRRVRIGTDEPAKLAEALKQVTGKAVGHGAAGEMRRRTAILVLTAASLIIVPLCIAVMFAIEMQPPTVTVVDNEFSVRSGVYSAKIPFGLMKEVTLEDKLPKIVRRSNGFALGSTLRGHFRLDRLGFGQLFVNSDAPPFVLVKSAGGSYVFVNFKDSDRTYELYEKLRGAPARALK